MIVVDASVLIAHFDSADRHHDRAARLLVDAAEEPLGASPLTLAELLVGPARAGTLTAAQDALRDLEVVTVPLDADAPLRLATLRATTRLRLPDCCVLLAAESVHGSIATFDERLTDAAVNLGVDIRS